MTARFWPQQYRISNVIEHWDGGINRPRLGSGLAKTFDPKLIIDCVVTLDVKSIRIETLAI